MPYTAPRHGYYLGPLGRLVLVRGPDEGHSAPLDLAVTQHRLLSGRVRTDRPVSAPRTYSLSWAVMSDSEKAWLEACAMGLVPGQLYWVDPLVRNQMPPSVSAPVASTVIAETLTTQSGTVAFRADGSQGYGGVDWVPLTGGPTELYATSRMPAIAGLYLTGSAMITRYSGTALFTSMNLDWYNAAGVFLSRSTGVGVTLTTLAGAYRIEAGAYPPAGAVEARLTVYTPDGRSFRVDSWQAEYGEYLAGSTFATGPGMAKVSILSYSPDVYLAGMTNVAMSMLEVV